MFSLLVPLFLVLSGALAAPIENTAAATVGKIRGVRDPIYHLYLQANSKNGTFLLHPYPYFPNHKQHPSPFLDPKAQRTNSLLVEPFSRRKQGST